MTRDLTELDKLEKYLEEKGYCYSREDEKPEEHSGFDIHRIMVYDRKTGRWLWDAICQRGSYGVEQGLLEIFGTIVDAKVDGDSVKGWMTAVDVIKRLETAANSQLLGI